MPKTLIALAYICLVPVNHDHVMYGPGQDGGVELELTDAQARQLLEVGAIKLKEDVPEVAAVVEAPAKPTAAPAAPAAAKPAAKK